jgi:hypothetical protein
MSVETDMRRFGARRFFELEAAIKPIRVRDVGAGILLAVGTRESNLMNVNNPAGTDRGVFQITDLYHEDWLADFPGCPEGSWIPEPGKTAADEGYCPTLADGARMAYTILSGGLFQARRLGTPQPVRFALAAYNAGVGGATKGFNEGDVDKYTTGGNYSKDVLTVRFPQVKDTLEKFGWF